MRAPAVKSFALCLLQSRRALLINLHFHRKRQLVHSQISDYLHTPQMKWQTNGIRRSRAAARAPPAKSHCAGRTNVENFTLPALNWTNFKWHYSQIEWCVTSHSMTTATLGQRRAVVVVNVDDLPRTQHVIRATATKTHTANTQ